MDVKRDPGGEILSLDVGCRLGGGGEGAIHPVRDSPELAAKIYHRDKLNAERVSKLRAMLAGVPADPMRGSKHAKNHPSIAWPVALLSSLNGDVVGFLMPRIQDAHQIADFYDVGTRQSRFPLFSYRHLCRTARNLASAVGAIHAGGYVIGDVKDENILATDEALVTLVDTDSFQVREPNGGRVYRCPVGSDMFTPPELLGKKFEEIDRSPEHDMFGVTVLFFQLLMEGTHPLACIYNGPGEPPDKDECVARGYFPYDGNPLLAPPTWAPRFETLHPRLQTLFRRCFVEGHADPRRRPDARTWSRALDECEQELTVCRFNRQHHYFKHVSLCPWCERARNVRAASAASAAGWDPFPWPNVAPAGARPGHSAAQTPAAPRHAPSSASAPAAAPTPAAVPAPSFTAGPTSVTIGQAVTLNWNVPNARSVRITDQSGRRIFVGNAPAGSVTVYPTKSRTYHLTAPGAGGVPPSPVAVSVTLLPRSVRLNRPLLELHQPTPLAAVRVGLEPVFPLKGVSVGLSALTKLRRYSPLHSYAALRRVSVKLKK
jgi:DNA-binding helix-hairpin-helix protein with protein kinase domain